MKVVKKFKDNYEFINYYIVLFLTTSIIGYILEFLYSLIFRNKLVNPGFLFGPYCPIYGIGLLILILTLSKLKKNKIILFFNSALICSIFEYIVSILLEVVFKKRIWDYSTFFLNINGRVCLASALIWGFLGVIFISKIEPLIYKKFMKYKDFGVILLAYLVLIIFLFDTFFSIISHLLILLK